MRSVRSNLVALVSMLTAGMAVSACSLEDRISQSSKANSAPQNAIQSDDAAAIATQAAPPAVAPSPVPAAEPVPSLPAPVSAVAPAPFTQPPLPPVLLLVNQPIPKSTTGLPTAVLSPNTFTEIDSPNGVFSLKMQTDGNLVEYRGGVATFSTRTYGIGAAPYTATLQSNGNLVLTQSTGASIYTTNSGGIGTGPYLLSLANDGNVTIIDATNAVVFATGAIIKTVLNTTPPAAPAGITYSNTINKFMTDNCSFCHFTGNQAPDLTGYANVSMFASLILTEMKAGVMPKNGSVSAAQINDFQAWITNGVPQ